MVILDLPLVLDRSDESVVLSTEMRVHLNKRGYIVLTGMLDCVLCMGQPILLVVILGFGPKWSVVVGEVDMRLGPQQVGRCELVLAHRLLRGVERAKPVLLILPGHRYLLSNGVSKDECRGTSAAAA